MPRNQESVYVGGQSRLTDKTTRKIRSERKKKTISRSLSYFNLSHSEFMFRKSFPGKISILNLESTCVCHNVRVSDGNILLGQN